MTPIDLTALVVVLQVFYPDATAANLARAMIERPEYFAGARQVGAAGDQILLPDGRVIDLIANAGAADGSNRWQPIGLAHVDADPNAIGLVPGPLVPVTIDQAIAPVFAPPFAELAAPWLVQIQAHETAIEGRGGELAGAADPGPMEWMFEATQGEGGYALHNQIRTFGELDPSDGTQATDDRGWVIENAQHDYPDPEQAAPPDITVEPNPNQTPPNNDDEGTWVDTDPNRQQQA